MANTIRGDLDALKENLIAATAGAISRVPNVRNRDVTGFYDGPWPLIMIRYSDYRVDLLTGGQPPLVGQNLKTPSLYSIEIEDVLAPDSSPDSEAVAAGQDDLIDLADAITAWFDHLPNRGLPLGGVNQAQYAGLPIRFRGAPPFREAAGGDIRLYLAGVIGVQGFPRDGSLT